MRRLTSAGRREEGAIATIVAMLFMFGVMLALGALTVDVGNINANRRQLQNGADAVALAAAKQCAETGTCPAPNDAGLVTLENANANPNAGAGVTGIRRVDGQTPAVCGVGPGLGTCPSSWVSSTANLQECPAAATALPAGTNYVRVYTQTTNAVGTHLLPYSFGAAIAGVGSGANQQTCASVAWGSPSAAAAPITLSYCEWAAATKNPIAGGARVFAAHPSGPTPGYGGASPQPAWPAPALQLPAPPVAGNEIIIGLTGTATTSNCATWNTHDAPGGFGYLATSTGCNSVAPINGWTKADSGNVLPAGCPSLLPYFNTVLYLPVFDCTVKITGSTPDPTAPPLSTDSCVGGAGSNTWYHIQGYAQFYLSGYTTSGAGSSTDKNHDRTQTVTPQAPCSGNDRCLSGWFLKGLVKSPLSPPGPGPQLGPYAIRNVG